MTPEDKLNAFFAEAAPPTRDLTFQAGVAERVARRRALATVFAMIPWTIAAIALCWAAGPMIAPVVEGLSRTLAPAAAILGLTGLGVVVLTASARRLRTV
ncbi:MAG: hypothetical protein KKA16_11915 [Alphaproteobacteria bacterium]|nr:hypothetical protein [Alphaproteobacteria bacterium]MBU2377725.1 hypothetical protein [Alphaproteobacteria bacterium]